jgi:hypothetical protein
VRKQPPDTLDKCGRRLPAGQTGPLQFPELFRDRRISFGGTVDDDWNEECPVFSHVPGAFDRQSPFTTEVALEPLVRMLRDDRNEQRTVVDLLADGSVPSLATSQLALVEPDLDTGRPECLADALGRFPVLRGVTQEYSMQRLSHRQDDP